MILEIIFDIFMDEKTQGYWCFWKEWLEWIEENRNSFSGDTLDLVQKQFVNDLGAMPIWFGDKKFQEDVLEGFKRYFDENSYFLDFFTNAYLAGLEEDGLR